MQSNSGNQIIVTLPCDLGFHTKQFSSGRIETNSLTMQNSKNSQIKGLEPQVQTPIYTIHYIGCEFPVSSISAQHDYELVVSMMLSSRSSICYNGSQNCGYFLCYLYQFNLRNSINY